jgi:uncharacterized damage-inducible protein DinB
MAQQPDERKEPDRLSGERQALEEWLDYHRQTLMMKCDGLSDEQLKTRSVEPSQLSLLGLLRHMTEVERGWFRKCAAQEEVEYSYCADDNPDGDFDDVDGADAQGDINRFKGEIEVCRAATKGLDLDTVVPSHGHHPERTRNLRWIYLHMIEEYARHNGHADLLRERIDGSTGD